MENTIDISIEKCSQGQLVRKQVSAIGFRIACAYHTLLSIIYFYFCEFLFEPHFPTKRLFLLTVCRVVRVGFDDI